MTRKLQKRESIPYLPCCVKYFPNTEAADGLAPPRPCKLCMKQGMAGQDSDEERMQKEQLYPQSEAFVSFYSHC